MHYPLAMLLLALMDQRACKELEEPGTVQQNKTDREEEDRGLADGDGGKRAGKGKEEGGAETWRRGLWGSWPFECRQLDPPERRLWRAAL